MNSEISETVQTSARAGGAAGDLLRELIDYAGLFPPAALAMGPSVANFEHYLRSDWNWILGRFITLVARLGEFEEAFAGLPTVARGTGSETWRLSVLLGSDPVGDVIRIREFNARMASMNAGRRAIVESVEAKAASAEEITQLSRVMPANLTVYFELPLADAGEHVAMVARCGRRAKIRMGGETAEKFPDAENVVEFIRLCAAAHVPFKATAGLHHPVRSVHRFTYQPESASGMMHGFVNVFLAAAFLRAGIKANLAVDLLKEQSAEAFHFEVGGIGWRDRWLDRQEIDAVRHEFAISFGSCSFMEPIEDLRSLHLL